MSDAARHAAFYVPEVTYGVTPDNPAFVALRHNSMSLGVQRGSLQSEELRADRQIADFRLGAVSVAGDIASELSFGSFDALLEAVLMGTWAPKATITAATISAAAADDSFNDSANGLVATGLEVGDLFATTGFTTPANNGTWRVASIVAGKVTVTLPGGGAAVAIADEVAAGGHKLESLEKRLKAGTVRRSFSVMRDFTDMTERFHLFKGVELGTLALAINPTAIVTATFGTLGREGMAPSAAAPAGATFGVPTTTAPLDAFSGQLKSGVTVVGEVTEFSISLENGLEVRNVVGSKLTIRPSVGRSNLTGSATVYFEDTSFLTKFINETDTSLSIELPDGVGNSYVITIPRFKFTGGQPDVSGQGSITLAMPFQGIFDPTTNTNILIRKVPAAA